MSEHDQLHAISGNALIHLYLHVAESPRFVPREQRNQLLVKYLKPFIKAPIYKPASKRIKALVHVGQKKGNLEKALLGVRKLVNDLQQQGEETDQRAFFNLFDAMEQSQWRTAVFKDGMRVESETLYVPEDHLAACFDSTGKQIAPVSLLARTAFVEELMLALAKVARFRLDVIQYNKDTQDMHIQLHPLA